MGYAVFLSGIVSLRKAQENERHRNRVENAVIIETSKPFRSKSKQLPFWIVLAFDS